MSGLPRVAVIGTGGTISGVGSDRLDLFDYGTTGRFMHVDELLDTVPELALVGSIVPIRYKNLNSTNLGPEDWLALSRLTTQAVQEHPDLDGIVITHGTASLEETAYFLTLSVKVSIPVVVVGAMRPSSALGADGGMNLLNAVRVAGSPGARGMGVLVVLNDEISAARDVTKTSNYRVQTFRTPDFGMLGYADGDAVAFYRKPMRRCAPDTEFDVAGLETLPRVDIIPAYGGADGVLIEAAVAAGARGLVSAGFPSGSPSPVQREALLRAAGSGVVVVQSSRAGSGRVVPETESLRRSGFVGGDTLTPQKARILLMLALTQTADPQSIKRMFATY